MEFSLLLEADCELVVPGWQGVCGCPRWVGGQGGQAEHPGRGLGKPQGGNGQQSCPPILCSPGVTVQQLTRHGGGCS